jgi:SAM-dependent methyltransferase
MKPDKIDYKSSWKNWGEEFKRHGASSRHTRRMLRRYMDGIRFKSIIDVGCGTGILLESLDKNLEKAGVDISESGIEICRQKMPEGRFRVMDIGKEIPKGKYDLCTCSEVLEHVKDDQKAMKNLRKICNYLVISVPCGKYGEDDKVQGHYRRYSEKDMFKKLEKAGFKILRYERWGFPFYSPIYRFLINKSKEEQRVGEMNFFKMIVSGFFYSLFFLNMNNRGDRLFLLAKAKNR